MKSVTPPSEINPYESARGSGEPSRPASRGSLLVIFLTVFIDLLGFGMVLPLLPIYAEAFGVKERGCLGIYSPKAFFDVEDDDWTRMFDVNVMSGVRLTRHYLKRMLDAKDWGRVVFVSSESAIFIPKEMVHYGFSKAAQLTIARGAAEQTKATNITVNSVLPGPTWVEMAPVRLAARAKGLGTTADELAAKTFTERRPSSLLQRYATPEEVANLICYVCSKAASATNGAALRADGGIVTNPF